MMTRMRAGWLVPGDMFFGAGTHGGCLITCVYVDRDEQRTVVGVLEDGALFEREYENGRLIYIVDL